VSGFRELIDCEFGDLERRLALQVAKADLLDLAADRCGRAIGEVESGSSADGVEFIAWVRFLTRLLAGWEREEIRLGDALSFRDVEAVVDRERALLDQERGSR
jgi:hypothetical protein